MTQSDSRGELTARDAQWPAHYQPEDEISLFDLWAVLARRKWQILAIWVVIVFLAVMFALTRPVQYRYSLTVEIGTRTAASGEQVPIEPIGAVVAKLENNYITSAIEGYLEDHPDTSGGPTVDASTPEASGIVVLSAEGPTERRETYQSIFEAAVARLQDDHAGVTEVQRAQLRQEIASASSAMTTAENEIERLQAEQERLDQRDELIRTQIGELEKQLEAARQERRELVQGNDTAAGNTLVLLNSDMRALSDRIAQLRTQLEVDLPARRDELQSRIAEQRETVQDRRSMVSVLETRLENMRSTRTLSEIQRSLKPVGTGKTVIVALGAILGLMLGVFLAFFLEFVSRANEHLRHMDGEHGQA